MNTVTTDLVARVVRLFRDGEFAEALSLMEEREDVVSQSSELCWHYGWALCSLGRFEEGRPRLERAVEIDPTTPAMWWTLALCEEQIGDIQSAEEHLIRALGIQDSYEARMSLSELYLDDDRPADAEAVLREGVRLRPDHRERLEALAEFLTTAGNADEARQLLDRAAQFPPRDARRRKQ